MSLYICWKWLECYVYIRKGFNKNIFLWNFPKLFVVEKNIFLNKIFKEAQRLLIISKILSASVAFLILWLVYILILHQTKVDKVNYLTLNILKGLGNHKLNIDFKGKFWYFYKNEYILKLLWTIFQDQKQCETTHYMQDYCVDNGVTMTYYRLKYSSGETFEKYTQKPNYWVSLDMNLG